MALLASDPGAWTSAWETLMKVLGGIIVVWALTTLIQRDNPHQLGGGTSVGPLDTGVTHGG